MNSPKNMNSPNIILIMGPKINKSYNLEVLIFKIMKSGFYDTNLEQTNSRKLLNLFLNKIII